MTFVRERARRITPDSVSASATLAAVPKQRFQNFIRIHCGRVWSDAIGRAVGTLGRLAGQMAN